MTEPTTLQMPVSQTARETLDKLHPAIKDDWRLKLIRIEDEAIDAWRGDHPEESHYDLCDSTTDD